MKIHDMKLQPSPFEAICNGTKRYEVRLWDEKRQKIQSGDFIRFTCTKTGAVICAQVLEIRLFSSFDALYRAIHPADLGYSGKDSHNADPKDMYRYYSREEELFWGAAALKLQIRRDIV